MVAYRNDDVFDPNPDVAPSVIGAEHAGLSEMDGVEDDVAESAYVPSERVTSRDDEVTLELRDTSEGYRAVLAFTSLQALVDGCGAGQPWVQVRGHLVDDLRQRSGADVVLWDAVLPADQQRTQTE